MKRYLLTTTTALALSTTMALAGGTVEPTMQPDVVMPAATSSSNGGLLVPLLLLLVLAAAGNNGGGFAASDIRLKTDIRRVGTTRLGLPLYHYRYHGLPQVYEGVMAQDVAILHPGAIRKMPYGYLAVDYAKLGLELRQVA